ncbi:EboA domain-containing protein [Terasakiella sp. SH-1]|uniref:EboA domain-containing protein n=1 Tax=Terasakiella sp. SH-1 TaxID=2560057 RepID=UPI0010747716|nr:EboA domain-containing protein [Terasakiella sp. SH-1]
MTNAYKDHLKNCLDKHLNRQETEWLEQQQTKLVQEPSEKNIFLAFALIARKIRKSPITFACPLQEETDTIWSDTWSLHQVARIYLLLSLDVAPPHLNKIVERLCDLGDVEEAATLYKGLHLLPEPERYLECALKATRSNMVPVFLAICHYSPFPFLYFSEDAWNNMILKALFLSEPLYPVYGFDQRAKRKLKKMAYDYAKERVAANRKLPLDIWRCMSHDLDQDVWRMMHCYAQTGSDEEKDAILSALAGDENKESFQLIDEIRNGREKP